MIAWLSERKEHGVHGSPLPVGLVGLGRHGRRYAKHLLDGDVPGARLVAVARRDAEKGRAFAREHGLRWYPNVEELAADPELVAAIVVLPPSQHVGAALALARAGKALLLEKPVATTFEGARALLAGVGAAGVPAMAAQTLRMNPVVRHLRERVAELGPLHFVRVSQRFEPAPLTWADDPEEGGVILNTGVHGCDLIQWLSEARITGASAMAERVVTRRSEDLFAAVLTSDRPPLLAALDNSRATGGRIGRIELVGERGQLLGDHVHGTVERVSGRRSERVALPAEAPTCRDVMRAFVSGLVTGAPPEIPLEAGVAAVEAALLIRAAVARAGSPDGADETSSAQ